MLDINLIRIDGGTQSRLSVNNDVVAEYAEAYVSGAIFPPVIVFFDGKSRWLADGFHRYFGAKKAGKTDILEDIRVGTKQDAFVYSLGANNQHGLKRTNADKRHAVELALANEELSKHSDNSISKICAVSQPFVSDIRKMSLITVISENPKERIFTNKHGTESTMQIANIGKTGIVATPKQVPEIMPITVITNEPEYTDTDALHDQISDLQAALVVANLGDVTEEEKTQASGLIAELRAQIKTLEATNKALIYSRDSYQNEVAQLKQQCAMQRREIEKLKA